MLKLLAIDGPSIVRRVYEASPEPDSAEKAQIALRHALSSFKKLLHTHTPSHVLVAFEASHLSSAETAQQTPLNWRQQLHLSYQHGALPSFLQQALPAWLPQLHDLGLQIVGIAGVEVSDMLATVVLRWLHEERGSAVICSNHRLLHSLIAQGAVVWDHFKQESHDSAWVMQKYGVAPQQLPDLLALVGDKAEGVPGVARIGLKTAAKLLQTYGDVDGVLAGAGILSDTVGKQLRQQRADLEISRQLMQLKTDVVLGVTWKMLAHSHF